MTKGAQLQPKLLSSLEGIVGSIVKESSSSKIGGLGEGEGVIRLATIDEDPVKDDKVEVPLVCEMEVTPHVACKSLRGIFPAWIPRMPFCNFLMWPT